jgi:hypothetical protein
MPGYPYLQDLSSLPYSNSLCMNPPLSMFPVRQFPLLAHTVQSKAKALTITIQNTTTIRVVQQA